MRVLLRLDGFGGRGMNFGEKLYCVSSEVFGEDTGRLVATFSHWNEAERFVEFYNAQYKD